jgi:hypothetical protein
MLDYVPDLNRDWIYKPEEWNNTWDLNCTHQPKTRFQVEAMGNWNLTAGNNSLLRQFPAIRTLLPPEGTNTTAWNFTCSSNGFWWKMDRWEELLFFVLVESQPTVLPPTNNETMHMIMTAIHLHNALMHENTTTPSATNLAAGPIEAYYIQAGCVAARRREPIDNGHVAFLWTDASQLIMKV